MGGTRRRAGVALAALLAFTIAPSATATVEPDALEVALAFASEHAEHLGVTNADVTDLFVTSQYTSDHSGVTHVNLNQRYDGLEVFGASATINVAPDGRVIFAAGNFTELTVVSASGAAAELDAIDAVEAAADALDLDEPADLEIIESSADEAVVSDGGISDAPIPARLGWQPTAEGLRLAWQLVIDDSSDVHLFNATIDAATGELLDVDDWTSHDTLESLEATLGGQNRAAYVAAESGPFPPIRVEDGSRYNVFQFPKNDPNDGPRSLVVQPADGDASPVGWHRTTNPLSSPPNFTITRGNNVHAYSDRDANNQVDPGSEAPGGPDLDFDFESNYLTEHPQTYVHASVTNLFYWCNIVHDVMWRYGFDEASGNFQVNNFGRGGNGGDDVICEAQDGSGENNANFSTPANDGGRPRMQMFLWPGTQFGLPNAVTIDTEPAVTFQAHYARFTPAPTTAGFPGNIVLVNDGVGTVTDGCSAFTLPPNSIALMDTSGTCNAFTRVTNAANAGAIAAIVAHNTTAAAPVLSGSMNPPVPIPAVSITQANGNTIKAALPISGSVHRNRDRVPMRDAAYRTETIFHEYGHGVSLRLTGGPTTNCLGGNEQAGEGWSDFLAIATLLNPAIDDPEGPRGYGQYALYADTRVGPGFRPRPYSRNMELQPFTYDSIKTGAWLDGASLALPHGLGHGWAAVLYDMTWDLVDKHGYNPNPYEAWHTGGNNRAIQYVMDGLKFQGCNPGLVVARDAIIAAADFLSQGEDTCMVWASFARRGLGHGAVQGTTNRNDNDEAFDTHPDCLEGFRAPIHAAYGDLNQMIAGDAKPLRFSAPGFTTANALHTNSPFSRKVDCETLRVPSIGAAVTPREYPLRTSPAGKSGLSRNNQGVFTYVWETDASWAGTCRELVLTRTDGKQHRAFFEFLAPPEE